MKKILIIVFTFALALETFSADKKLSLKDKLSILIIEKTPVLEGKTVSEAIAFLGKEIRESGESKVNIYFDAHSGNKPADPWMIPLHMRDPDKTVYDPTKVKLKGAPLPFVNITVVQFLEIIMKTAERPTRYYIDESEVVLLERDYVDDYFFKNFIFNDEDFDFNSK